MPAAGLPRFLLPIAPKLYSERAILTKRKYLFIFPALVLLFLTACGNKRANLQLEPDPHAISRRLNIPAARHPRVVLDPSGDTVYVLAVTGTDPVSQLALLTSVNGGDTFEPPVAVNEPGTNVSSHGENSPMMLFGPGEKLYTMWEQPEGDAAAIMFAESLDFGATFEKPVRVSDQLTPTYSGYPTLAVAANKTVCAAWLDFREQITESETASIYLSCLIDEGSTFSKNLKVADGVCPCCRPTVVYGPQGQLMIFWRRVFPGNIRDMVVSISTDQGNTFVPPVRVAEDNWKLEGCPDSGPAAMRVGNRVYVAWLTEANRARAGVRLAWIDDGGKTFSLPVRLPPKQSMPITRRLLYRKMALYCWRFRRAVRKGAVAGLRLVPTSSKSIRMGIFPTLFRLPTEPWLSSSPP